MYVTVNQHGQLVLPPIICQELHLQAGNLVNLVIESDNRVKFVSMVTSITELKGILPPASKILSLEEMDAAIALGAIDQ